MINTYRMEKSKLLLKNTDMPISEVAGAVGFASFSYYSKLFRAQVSLTPSAYRKAERFAREAH